MKRHNQTTSMLLIATLILASCAEIPSVSSSNAECGGGNPINHLVYKSFPQPRLEPAPDAAIPGMWNRTPHFGNDYFYVEFHAEKHTDGENWQTLDRPLTPNSWVGATRRSDLFRFSAGVWISDELFMRQHEIGGKDVRYDEFCIDGSGQIFQRRSKER